MLEARQEEEARRRQKYAKMEAERENVRQGIRDKVQTLCHLKQTIEVL